MSGAAAFGVNLGDALHKNFNQQAYYIGQLEQNRRGMDIQEKQMEEERRQAMIQEQMAGRSMDMSAMQQLAAQRANAMAAGRGQIFKSGLLSRLRG